MPHTKTVGFRRQHHTVARRGRLVRKQEITPHRALEFNSLDILPEVLVPQLRGLPQTVQRLDPSYDSAIRDMYLGGSG